MICPKVLAVVVAVGVPGALHAQVTWEGIPDAYGEAAVFDSTLQQVVRFGGSGSAQTPLDLLRVYDPNTGWSLRAPSGGPGPLSGGAFAPINAVGSSSVLFGGTFANGQSSSQTWLYDGNSMSLHNWGSGPAGRAGHAMAYDSIRGKIVLFGGANGTTLYADTWEFDTVNGWIQVFPASSPSARRDHAMSFDVARGEMVLYGGLVPAGPHDETWVFDGLNWRVGATGSLPGVNGELWLHRMASNDQGQTLLVGGLRFWNSRNNEFTGSSDTYRWSGINWNAAPSLPWAGRWAHTLNWDPLRRVFVVHGGLSGRSFFSSGGGGGGGGGGSGGRDGRDYHGTLEADTLEWDGIQTGWLHSPAGFLPRARQEACAAASPNGILVFGGRPHRWNNNGGFSPLNDMWLYSNGRWTSMPSGVITARARHAMCWDSINSNYVIFGGNTGSLSSETWVGSPTSGWLLRTFPGPAREYAAMVSTAHGVLLHGGHNSSIHLLADCYLWNGTTWAPIPGGPSGRNRHTMAYDSRRDRVVLFGGSTDGNQGGVGSFADTWEWDGFAWTQRLPSHAPTTLAFHGMAYDAARERVVLFGGVDGSADYHSEVWEWDGLDWTLRSPIDPVAGRAAHSLVYDPATQRVVALFGEVDGITVVEPWEFFATAQASFEATGSSCPGALGALSASAPGSLPWIGSAFPVAFGNLPAACLPVVLIGLTSVQIDLGSTGFPGCTLLASIDSSSFLGFPVAGTAQWNQVIPNVAAFVGIQLHYQGAAINAGGGNHLGLAFSNRLTAMLGLR